MVIDKDGPWSVVQSKKKTWKRGRLPKEVSYQRNIVEKRDASREVGYLKK